MHPSSRARVPTLALGVAFFVASAPAAGKVYLSQERALEIAFGKGAAVERATAYLTEAQLSAARDFAGPGVEIRGALVTRYSGRSREGTPLGTAYFDAHRVRTLPETLMIVVAPDGTVARVEILSFSEPEEYRPPERWLAQFPGRVLDRELAVRRGIHGITGATLSAGAVTDAVRRTLAIHRVLGREARP